MYTYKIHIFIDAYDIIIKYNKSYYTYIKLFNKTTSKYHYISNYIFMKFFLYFYKFWSILGLSIFFFQNIRQYISYIFDISVTSKYRYICDYRYFHHWLHVLPQSLLLVHPNIKQWIRVLKLVIKAHVLRNKYNVEFWESRDRSIWKVVEPNQSGS